MISFEGSGIGGRVKCFDVSPAAYRFFADSTEPTLIQSCDSCIKVIVRIRVAIEEGYTEYSGHDGQSGLADKTERHTNTNHPRRSASKHRDHTNHRDHIHYPSILVEQHPSTKTWCMGDCSRSEIVV